MLIIQAKTNPGLARCESCGQEAGFICDKAFPRVKQGAEGDVSLWLEDPGSNLISVANEVRLVTGLSSEKALALVRKGKCRIARLARWRIEELQELQRRLTALGAVTKLD